MPAPLATKVAGRDLHGISYNDVKPGKPPIPITTAPRPSSAQANLHPSLRPTTSPQPSLDGSSAQSIDRDQVKRDSGYTVTTSIGRDSRTTLATDTESVRKSHSIRKSQSLPGFNGSAKQSPSSIRISKRRNDPKTKPQESNDKAPKLPDPTFMNKPTELPTLPTISFEDLTKLEQLEFSKRGSLLISGRRASEMSTPSPGRALSNGSTNKAVASAISTVLRIPQRALSDDEEALSLKVRSMYDTGMDPDSASAVLRPSMDGRPGIEEEVIEEEPASPGGTLLTADDALQRRISSNTTAGRASFIREDRELAGGIEDWQDVDAAEVDRYGFIVPQPAVSASTNSLPAPELRLHRVSTALQAASETPRRSHSRIGRAPSMTHPARSASGNSHHTKALVRPVSSQSSYVNKRSVSRVRSAANRLPHNRNRRAMDEAGDMLTLRPGLADLAEQVEGSRNAGAARKKESAREEKWRKMAKATKPHGPGGNTRYEFDTKDPKVILRTWKGIPDRWRATAWHSFLTASAKRRKGFVPDEDLMAAFDELVGQSSPDDVQIDIDVPRTINSHIMFRRRYRGGQRLLFRVLHALSLYFPDTGYVQGMAALAATFLCYFDEQMAFVMLVRLWQVRGLDRLYKSGFAGLIQALDEFERAWLAGGVVSAKLVSLIARCETRLGLLCACANLRARTNSA